MRPGPAGCCGAGRSRRPFAPGGTAPTGHGAWCRTACASRAEAHALEAARPREPTTSIWASAEAASRAARRGPGQNPLHHRHLGMLLGRSRHQVPELLFPPRCSSPSLPGPRRPGRTPPPAARHAARPPRRRRRGRPSPPPIRPRRPPPGPGPDSPAAIRRGRRLPAPRRARPPARKRIRAAGRVARCARGSRPRPARRTCCIRAQHVRSDPLARSAWTRPGSEHRLGVRQPAGQDLLTVLPGQVTKVRLGGQRHMVGRPGQAHRQRRPADLGFPGRPAQRVAAARRPRRPRPRFRTSSRSTFSSRTRPREAGSGHGRPRPTPGTGQKVPAEAGPAPGQRP